MMFEICEMLPIRLKGKFYDVTNAWKVGAVSHLGCISRLLAEENIQGEQSYHGPRLILAIPSLAT